MTTAIIGTGGTGPAIARRLASGGETLRLSSADTCRQGPSTTTRRVTTVPAVQPVLLSLYEESAVPASGVPLFQASAANLNPWTKAKVDTENPGRGPILLISGEKDHTFLHSITRASYKLQARDQGVTEFTEIENRGHSLTIDSGWREVADTALNFVKRFS